MDIEIKIMKIGTTKYKENKEKAKYCIGCAWLHIGMNVCHNHCDYSNEDWDELQKRVNSRFEYISYDGGKTFKLSSHWEQCRWFWDEKLNPNPSKEGFFYKAPSKDACPKIPKVKINNQ